MSERFREMFEQELRAHGITWCRVLELLNEMPDSSARTMVAVRLNAVIQLTTGGK